MGCSCLVIQAGLILEFTYMLTVATISQPTMMFRCHWLQNISISEMLKCGKIYTLKLMKYSRHYKLHLLQCSDIHFNEEQQKIRQKPAFETTASHYIDKCFWEALSTIITSFNFKSNISAVLPKFFLPLLMLYCDHIPKINCCATYKT